MTQCLFLIKYTFIAVQSYKSKSHAGTTNPLDAPGAWDSVVQSALCILAGLGNVQCVQVFSFASSESVCFVPPRES